MDLKSYAESELDLYLPYVDGEDEFDRQIKEHLRNDVMALINIFCNQEHSGASSHVVLDIFNRLAHYKPITKLTGADSEWVEADEETYQNVRCSTVFKEKKTGKVYDINGKVFSDDGGKSYYMTENSRTYISFPYNPPTKPRKIITRNYSGDTRNGKRKRT